VTTPKVLQTEAQDQVIYTQAKI